MTRTGILAAGNFIVDHVKMVDAYPHQDGLANIGEAYRSNGGSPYNILKDLALMGASFPLAAAGLVGADADGDFIRQDCARLGIDIRHLRQTKKAPTSYTDVMTVSDTGRRTFFHQRGANALFKGERLDFGQLPYRFFHLGYLMLLDALDAPWQGRPRAADLLARARAAGCLTSVDIVSEASDRFRSVVPPVLPEVDYLFLNEYEASQITGVSLKGLHPEAGALAQAGQTLLNMGVRRWVFIHFTRGVFGISARGEAYRQAALSVPADQIRGAAGAGDALATGVLWGLHEGWDIQACLQLGVCTAAASLLDPTCSGGIGSLDEVLALGQQLGMTA
ncbi:MAG: carbohydrate kinase family protein [Bacteroidetes bacterium]|nr:MAG: carbohydrate kinase family protein [Bacteroidota bacterium]